MSVEIAKKGLGKQIKAIELIRKEKLVLPSLMLIYCSIDVAAYLAMPDKDSSGNVKFENTKSDFVSWIQTYFSEKYFSANNIEPLDLYAARCGIVHSLSADTKLVRERKSRAIIYSWGNASNDDLAALIKRARIEKLATIHIDALFAEFREANTRFFKAVKRHSDLRRRVATRAAKFFVDQPKDLTWLAK